ncbi:MAG TPA: hypothetical protein VLM88_05660 [Proteiniclasticum sp.]|nr:hypothetical protein [Proteiniclasticum sp.]
MENKLTRKYALIFVWTIVGYFIGGVIFHINGGGDSVIEFFSQLLGAAIGTTVSSTIIFMRNPKLKTMEKVLSNDERIRVIRGEASYYTFIGTLFLSLAVVIIGEIQGHFYLSFGAAIVGGLMFVMNVVTGYILSKVR